MNLKLKELVFFIPSIIQEMSAEEIAYLTSTIPISEAIGADMNSYIGNYKDFLSKTDIKVSQPLYEKSKDFLVNELRGSYFLSIKDIASQKKNAKKIDLNILKVGLVKIIEDVYIDNFLNNYIGDDKFTNNLEIVQKYLKDNQKYISIATLVAFHYIDSNKSFILEDEEKIYSLLLKNYIEHICVSKQINLPEDNKFNELANDYDSLQNYAIKLEKQNDSLRLQNNEYLNINKQFTDILNNIKQSIGKSQINYSQLLKEAKEFKYDVMENTFSNTINNLTNQISDYKTQLRDLKIKNKELATEITSLNKEIEVLSKELNNKKEELENFKSEDFQDIENIQESAVTEDVTPSHHIGYCEISDDKHNIVLLDGTKNELLNLPEKQYLTDGQFIKVDNDFNFMFSYTYYKEESLQGLNIGVIRMYNDTPSVWVNGKKVDVVFPPNFNLKDNQIIGLDGNNNLKMLFKFVRPNLDNFYKSINLKNQKVYFYMKSLNKGMLVRDILKDEETFLPICIEEYEGKKIEPGNVLIFDSEDNLITVIKNSRFYTLSSFYHYSKIAVIVEKEGEIFCRLQDTGETFKANHLDREVKDEDLVIVDEFMNVLQYLASELEEKHMVENRRKRREKVTQKYDKIEITHNVLIVGNVNYKTNYVFSFLKEGYKAEVVDGYSPYNKISSQLKDADYVIVVSDYCQHDNMWRLKKEDIPVIFPKSNGANRIIEEFNAYLKNQ